MSITIEKQIAFLRKQLGMTQEELAGKLGVSNQAVSKWESGQCCPDISLLPELAELFRVSVDELLGKKPAPHAEDALLSLHRTACSLPEQEQHSFILRAAAVLHAAVLSSYMASHAVAQPQWDVKSITRTPWNYSCVDAPSIITVKRRDSVFFSKGDELELSSKDCSRISSLLNCFADEKALRTAASLYQLTAPSEDLYCPVSQISAASGLPEDVVTVCLQTALSELLAEKQKADQALYRFDGPYRHIMPLLSLLSSAG